MGRVRETRIEVLRNADRKRSSEGRQPVAAAQANGRPEVGARKASTPEEKASVPPLTGADVSSRATTVILGRIIVVQLVIYSVAKSVLLLE
jgi:hypothetical protein